jgi:hypothetical protein
VIDGKRLVACIPAGRRRFLELLVPQVLADRRVDSLELWQNTADLQDLAWMADCAHREPRIKLVHASGGIQPSATGQYNDTVWRFYAGTAGPNTVYCRFDDDIVWVAGDYFSQAYAALIREPRPIYVLSNVVNSPKSDQLARPLEDLRSQITNRYLRTEGPHAEQVHRRFLDAIDSDQLQAWLWPDRDEGPARHRIGVMSWLGEEGSFWRMVGSTDELTVGTEVPKRLNRSVRYAGSALVSHFAFGWQHGHLDATDLLSEYASRVKIQ